MDNNTVVEKNGSTAFDRVAAIENLDSTLLNRKIRLFSNGEYHFFTIKEYLENIYPDDMAFVADKMCAVLKARANEADRILAEEIEKEEKTETTEPVAVENTNEENVTITNEFVNKPVSQDPLDIIIETKLTDEKYRTPIRKDENWYMTFVEYVRCLPSGTVTEDGIKYGLDIVSFDEMYEKFARDVYVEMDPELKDLVEPSEEEQEKAIKQHKTGIKLEEIISSRDLNRDDIVNNTNLMDKIMNEFVDSFTDFDQALADGSLVDGLNNIINNDYIMSQKSEDVKILEESVKEIPDSTPVSQIDEMLPTQYGISTPKTDELNLSERNAMINPGLTYAEQLKTEPIAVNNSENSETIKMSGPEDDETEIEANDGVEEIPASLDEVRETIKMRS